MIPRLFNGFVAAELGQRGLTIPDFEDLVRDDLRIKKIKAILSASAPATEPEIRAAFTQMFQKLDASVIRLKLADFLPAIQVTDEDLKKSFDQRKGSSEVRRAAQGEICGLHPAHHRQTAGWAGA